MPTLAVHRLVEEQAAARGESLAYADGRQTLTYREVNARANTVARGMMAAGFRRGALAAVRLPRSADLVVTLLAVLKAGGAYLWIDADDGSWPAGVSIRDRIAGGDDRWTAIDVAGSLAGDVRPGPNLPVLMRGSDIACVLPDRDGSPAILVPHSTVVALRSRQVRRDARWAPENGAIELWLALMTGGTLTPATVTTVAA